MGAESRMRQEVVGILKPADAISVENSAYPGTPDINYLHGWIELKQRPDWPARARTVVKIDHFSKQQRVWLRRRSARGGRCHMLLKVGQDWLLIEGSVAAKRVGFTTKNELIRMAEKVWRGGLNRDELLAWALNKDTDEQAAA